MEGGRREREGGREGGKDGREREREGKTRGRKRCGFYLLKQVLFPDR